MAQTFSVNAARVFLTDGTAFGRILVLRRGPSLSYLSAINETFLVRRRTSHGSRKVSMRPQKNNLNKFYLRGNSV